MSTLPNLPVPSQTNMAVQNDVTGQIDYLQFTGTTLTSSKMVDFGIPGWNVVAEGGYINFNEDLVTQNAAGAVDFLGLDAHGNLVSSAMSNAVVPRIVGAGFFGPFSVLGVNQFPLVSQLPNGELDMLAFNSSGRLVASDLVANTVGFARAVGVATAKLGDPTANPFSGVGSTDDVLLQLPDGSIDAVGFSGSFANATLSASTSFLLPGSAGSPALQEINPENASDLNYNLGESGNRLEGVQMIGQLANGSFDALYADSGYDSTHEGNIYASELLNLSLPGWHAVDATGVTGELFPYK
jgi:hypothetical protein